MKWFGISGSWRQTNAQVEEDVRRFVYDVIMSGNGIVSGGALGVDYIATDEALRINPKATHIHIFLPTTLEIYTAHYRKRAKEGVITNDQAEKLITQLETLKKANPTALTENHKNTEANEATYFERNQAVVDASDELLAFQVNGSKGVQDTLEKAEKKGIPFKLFSYTIK